MFAVFDSMSARAAYLDQHLGDVSRSFALVIPFLETPLRHYLATAYLLCRVVDNIEDCTQPATWKQQRFAEFSQLLRSPRDARAILSQWQDETWPALSDQERRLMGVTDGLGLWQIYAEMPQSTQETVHRWTSIMAQGMSQMDDSQARPFSVQREGLTVLEAEADYDEYCYIAAGTVGHLATELVIEQYQLSEDVTPTLRALAEACGRSMQKTNIVKDFVVDLTRGICYLPDAWMREADYTPLALRGAAPAWKAMVLEDVLDDFRAATEYVLALPHSALGYRRASLLCLLPAYQTIYLAAQRQDILFTREHQIKISRPTMARCVADSQVLLFDNRAIRRYTQGVEDKIHEQLDLYLNQRTR
jgi:farnesyl-diphosphate farnesyltransferase